MIWFVPNTFEEKLILLKKYLTSKIKSRLILKKIILQVYITCAMTYIILSRSLGNVRSSMARAMAPVTMTPKRPVYKLRVQVLSLGSLYFCVRVAPAEKTPAVPTRMYLTNVMREIKNTET